MAPPRTKRLAWRAVFDGRSVRITHVAVGTVQAAVLPTLLSWLDAAPLLLALDAPLAWPQPLAQSLAAHIAGAPLALLANTLFRR